MLRISQIQAASNPKVLPTEEQELPSEPTDVPAGETPLPEDPAEQQPGGGGNVDPAVARYLGPESRCQGCVHFSEPGSCEIVAGAIDPQGVCSLFTPDEDAQSEEVHAPAEETTEPPVAETEEE